MPGRAGVLAGTAQVGTAQMGTDQVRIRAVGRVTTRRPISWLRVRPRDRSRDRLRCSFPTKRRLLLLHPMLRRLTATRCHVHRRRVRFHSGPDGITEFPAHLERSLLRRECSCRSPPHPQLPPAPLKPRTLPLCLRRAPPYSTRIGEQKLFRRREPGFGPVLGYGFRIFPGSAPPGTR